MSLNIGRDQTDKSYRYKMPKLVTKIEGRGNGIKTVIVNMDDIARALHCPNIYPTKFFGIELGAQSKYDTKTDRAIVNGKHDASTLAELLNKFIEQFILCPTCKLPEINMDVKKSGAIKIDCRACGHNSQLKSAHKLVGFILNNPPSNKKKGGDKDKEAKDKESPEASADEKKEVEEEPEEEVEIQDSEVQWFSDTSKEAADARKEAEFQEMRNGSKKSVDAILAASSSGTAEPPTETLRKFLAEANRDVTDIISEVRRLQLARGFTAAERLNIVVQSIVDYNAKPKAVVTAFTNNAKLLRSMAEDRSGQHQLIGAVELLTGEVAPKLAPCFPAVLKALYDTDVLPEDAIITWHELPADADPLANKKTALELRKSASTFVDWLKNAEEESEEDD